MALRSFKMRFYYEHWREYSVFFINFFFTFLTLMRKKFNTQTKNNPTNHWCGKDFSKEKGGSMQTQSVIHVQYSGKFFLSLWLLDFCCKKLLFFLKKSSLWICFWFLVLGIFKGVGGMEQSPSASVRFCRQRL